MKVPKVMHRLKIIRSGTCNTRFTEFLKSCIDSKSISQKLCNQHESKPGKEGLHSSELKIIISRLQRWFCCREIQCSMRIILQENCRKTHIVRRFPTLLVIYLSDL